MMFVPLLVVLFVASVSNQVEASSLVLSEKMMTMSLNAANLSSVAYDEHPPPHAFDYFGFYTADPDQALVVKDDGYCYVAFRGTTPTLSDWEQNVEIGDKNVCGTDKDGNEVCCETRIGFFKAYANSFRDQLEASLRKCAEDCTNPDECVILTGHSQGGSVAAVAALFLADLNPRVITFGQPPTVFSPCSLIQSSRWIRYVNTKSSDVGLLYDPVPFLPGLGADNFGWMLMLSDDDSGVANIGLDAQERFGVGLNAAGIEAHNIETIADGNPGYLNRIANIMDRYADDLDYPVRKSGYSPGFLCTEDVECETETCDKDGFYSTYRCQGTQCGENSDCDSGRCDNGLCLPKLDACMKCNENSDCLYNKCMIAFDLNYYCANEDGLMDDGCFCGTDFDCESTRCVGFDPAVCEPKLKANERCLRNAQCESGNCTWRFRCATKSFWAFVGENGVVGVMMVAVGSLLAFTVSGRVMRKINLQRSGYEQIPSI